MPDGGLPHETMVRFLGLETTNVNPSVRERQRYTGSDDRFPIWRVYAASPRVSNRLRCRGEYRPHGDVVVFGMKYMVV